MIEPMKRLAIIALVAAACSRSEPAKHDRPPEAPGAAHEPGRAAGLHLEVRIDGVPATWTQDVFDRVEHHAVKNKSGQPRDTWSLRDLAHATAGEHARVVSVIGTTTQTIAPDAWADASRTPIVHRTGRGGLKFRWADAAGTWEEANVGDVVALEIVR